MKKRVFIYVRVSTQEQAKEGYSVKEQEIRLRAYAESRDYQVVKVYTDAGHTGANINRPAMQEMIKNIKSVDSVLVYKLDRLSRSQKDTLFLIEDIFLKNNVDFVSLNESFDTSTPFGRAMIGILSVFAQLEREQIKERSMMGREARAKEGYYHGGGKALIGYDYIDGHLVINDYEAECIRYCFNRYIEGAGLNKIIDEIGEKFPNTINSPSTLMRTMTKVAYTGKITFKNEIYEGKHTPIIDEKTFDKVQWLMKSRSIDTNPFKRQYLLTGIAVCGVCGSGLYGDSGSMLATGERARYYRCYGRKDKNITCNKKSIRKEILEEEIIQSLKKMKSKKSKSKALTDDGREKKIKIYEDKVKAVDKQISKLVDLFSVGNMDMSMLTKKIDQLNEEKEKILLNMNKLINRNKVDIDGVNQALSQLSDIDELDDVDKRVVVARLINQITVHDDKVIVDWAI